MWKATSGILTSALHAPVRIKLLLAERQIVPCYRQYVKTSTLLYSLLARKMIVAKNTHVVCFESVDYTLKLEYSSFLS